MEIQNFMKEHGYSQTDLAKMLNTSVQNVNKWVNGRGVPSYEFCQRLLQIGMSVEDLFGIQVGSQNASRLEPMTTAEFIDILKETLDNSLDGIKARIKPNKTNRFSFKNL